MRAIAQSTLVAAAWVACPFLAPACSGSRVTASADAADEGQSRVLHEASTGSEGDDAADGATSLPWTSRHLADGSPLAITSSTDLVYVDSTTRMHAIPLAGGAAVDVDPGLALSGSSLGYGTLGGFFYVDAWKNQGAGGTLGIWSRATGSALAPSQAVVGLPGIDPSGKWILYGQPSAAGGVDVMVASVGFAGAVNLATRSNAFFWNGAQAWLGQTAVVLSGPTSPTPDAGTLSLVLSAFAAPSWQARTLSTRVDVPGVPGPVVPPMLVDPNGAGVVLVANGGQLTFLPLDGSSPVVIESGATPGYFLHDGSVIYATAAGLRASPAKAPAPVTLTSTGVTGFRALSPDENWIIFGDASGNVRLASTHTPGTDAVLGSDQGSQWFTADSTYALLLTYDTGTLQGPLIATPVSGGPGRTVASEVSVIGVSPLSGTAMLVFDDVVTGASGYLQGNLDWIDVSSTALPTTIAKQFGGIFVVSNDGKHAAYADPTAGGVDVIDFP